MSQVTITHSEIRDHEYLEELLHNFLNPKGKAGFKAQAKVMDKIQLELLQFEKYQCSYFNWAVHKLFGSMIADNFSSPAVGEIEAIQTEYYYRCNLSKMDPEVMAEGYRLVQPYLMYKERLAKESMQVIKASYRGPTRRDKMPHERDSFKKV
jgi:hypothetical protein